LLALVDDREEDAACCGRAAPVRLALRGAALAELVDLRPAVDLRAAVAALGLAAARLPPAPPDLVAFLAMTFLLSIDLDD
jgi:hypothetical protein